MTQMILISQQNIAAVNGLFKSVRPKMFNTWRTINYISCWNSTIFSIIELDLELTVGNFQFRIILLLCIINDNSDLPKYATIIMIIIIIIIIIKRGR